MRNSTPTAMVSFPGNALRERERVQRGRGRGREGERERQRSRRCLSSLFCAPLSAIYHADGHDMPLETSLLKLHKGRSLSLSLSHTHIQGRVGELYQFAEGADGGTHAAPVVVVVHQCRHSLRRLRLHGQRSHDRCGRGRIYLYIDVCVCIYMLYI